MDLGRHWCTWRHIGYVLYTLLIPLWPYFRECCLWRECSRQPLPLSPQNTHQMSVHQRYPDGEMEGFAVQYSGEPGKDHYSTLAQEKHSEPVQDAYLIFGTRPSDHMRFVQHSRTMRCDKSSCSESEARVTFKKTKLRRKKDPARPRGYTSGFNFFVKETTPKYPRLEKVMSCAA